MLADFLKRFYKPGESGLTTDELTLQAIADLEESQKALADTARKLGQLNLQLVPAQQAIFAQLNEKIKRRRPESVGTALLFVLDGPCSSTENLQRSENIRDTLQAVLDSAVAYDAILPYELTKRIRAALADSSEPLILQAQGQIKMPPSTSSSGPDNPATRSVAS